MRSAEALRRYGNVVTDGVRGAAPGDRDTARSTPAPGGTKRHTGFVDPFRSEGRGGTGRLVLLESLGLEPGSVEALVEFTAEPLDRLFVHQPGAR
jgi:hypothetical protein